MIDYAMRQFCTERQKQLMSIKAVLFDLDGTLLPMNMDDFTTGYFGMLAKKLAPYGYEPKSLVDAIWTGTEKIVKNNQKARKTKEKISCGMVDHVSCNTR